MLQNIVKAFFSLIPVLVFSAHFGAAARADSEVVFTYQPKDETVDLRALYNVPAYLATDTVYYKVLDNLPEGKTVDIISVMRGDEKGNVILSQYHYAEPFKEFIDRRREECKAGNEAISSQELEAAVQSMAFQDVFTGYATCRQFSSPPPKGEICTMEPLLKELARDGKQPPRIPELPPALDKNFDLEKSAGKDCRKQAYTIHLLKNSQSINGKSLFDLVCDVPLSVKSRDKVVEECKEVGAIWTDIMAKKDPAQCERLENYDMGDVFSAEMCRVLMSNNPELCNDAQDDQDCVKQCGDAEQCKAKCGGGETRGEPCHARYLMYKAFKDRQADVAESEVLKRYVSWYAAVKENFSTGACQKIYKSEINDAFCDWKYDPERFDMQKYFQKDVEFMKKYMEEELE